jgi:hypothetical protein
MSLLMLCLVMVEEKEKWIRQVHCSSWDWQNHQGSTCRQIHQKSRETVKECIATDCHVIESFDPFEEISSTKLASHP